MSPRVQAGVTAGSAPGHGAGQYGVVLPASGCTLVVAAAGYGKTAAVRAALAGAPVQWLADGDAAGAGTATTRDQWVVFDDLRPATLDGLLADGPGDRMVLLSRVPPPRSYVRWRGRGLLTEFGPADLVLSTARVAELMRSEYGLDDPEVAVQVHALTAGWPALVHLAGQALRASPVKPAGVLAAIASVGGTIATYVTQELLPDVPAEVRRLLRDLAPLGQVSAGLCQALGRRRAHDHVALLARIGLLSPPVPGRLSYRLVPVIAAVVRQTSPRSTGKGRDSRLRAADWYARHGPLTDAVLAYREAGADAQVTALLLNRGPELLASGGARHIVETMPGVGATSDDPRLRLLLAEALQYLGDSATAAAIYGDLAGEGHDLDPGLARPLGELHRARGQWRAALNVFDRSRLGAERTVDEALLLAGAAVAHWMLGHEDTCMRYARRAHHAASAAADERALAAAHVALAMAAALSGDWIGCEEHYERALRLAQAAGDIGQATRIRINRTARLLEQSRYAEALTEIRSALTLTRQTGDLAREALALSNQGEALHRTGNVDEAIAALTRSVSLFQQIGSRQVAYPLVVLGEVHRRRGWTSLARAEFEQAIRVAEPDGDWQALVPALAGLARVLIADDPQLARQVADRASQRASGPAVCAALLAQGWTALDRGDLPTARQLEPHIAEAARQRRNPAALAESLELKAAVADNIAGTRHALTEAHAIWRHAGANHDADRVAVALGRLRDATAEERHRARLADHRTTEAGIQLPTRLRTPAAPLSDPPAVIIRTLGRFDITVAGHLLSPSDWQSRKARDLLRILIIRRGRPVPRDELGEMLWPGDASNRINHRLSVLLSIIRAKLDPDRRIPADHYLIADPASIMLDNSHLTVDADTFLADAAHGLRLRRSGELRDARLVLAAAATAYRGDFLEDEPYDEWAAASREELRATFLRVARTAAELNRQAGDLGETITYLLRILEKDPHDERCHQDLINTLRTAGQHGEARRAHHRYTNAMRDIGVQPISTPDPIRTS